jgi:NAD(P)-dependent dehydrogenase (short-subunit alcohol dehydrogenase family)
MNSSVVYDFSNQVVLVTGSATGIGRATALAFAKSKASLALVDCNQSENERTAALVKEAGASAITVPCDVSNTKQIEASVKHVIMQLGAIDVAFNNAGIEGVQASTIDCTEENWDRVISTNLKSVWLFMKYQIQQMLLQKKGSIINCSSIAGLVGFPNVPAYVASKHGILGLTKTAALEFAKSNIRINAVCPGVIQTPMIERFTKNDQAALKQLESAEPMGRLGSPEEIAAAVLWLASNQSSFVTGQAIPVDGGWISQ